MSRPSTCAATRSRGRRRRCARRWRAPRSATTCSATTRPSTRCRSSIAALLGNEAALFVTSGTQGNLCAMHGALRARRRVHRRPAGAHLPLGRRRRGGARQRAAAAAGARSRRLAARWRRSRPRSSPTTRTSRAPACCAWRTPSAARCCRMATSPTATALARGTRPRDPPRRRAAVQRRGCARRRAAVAARARSRSALRQRVGVLHQGPRRAGRLGAVRLARRSSRGRTAVRKMLGGGMRQAGRAGGGGARTRSTTTSIASPKTTRSRGAWPSGCRACRACRSSRRRPTCVFVDLSTRARAAGAAGAPASSAACSRPACIGLRFVTHLDVDAAGVDRAVAAVARAPDDLTSTETCDADHQPRRADPHHRPPRDLPRRDAGAGAPHHERRDVAGDDGGAARSACASRRRRSARSPPRRR